MKRKITIILLVMAVFLLFAIVFFFNARRHITTYKMFADQNELNQLDEFLISKNIKDENIKTQTVVYSYSGIINYNKVKYNFYAYKFQTNKDAQKYFCSSTDKRTTRTYDYSFSVTPTKVLLIVYKEDKCYLVSGITTVKEFNKFHKYLNDIFSEKIN